MSVFRSVMCGFFARHSLSCSKNSLKSSSDLVSTCRPRNSCKGSFIVCFPYYAPTVFVRNYPRQAFSIFNLALGFRLTVDQFRQTFSPSLCELPPSPSLRTRRRAGNPELDVAKQLGREIFRPRQTNCGTPNTLTSPPHRFRHSEIPRPNSSPNDGKRQRKPRKTERFKNHANIEKGENREIRQIREPRSWRRKDLDCSRISRISRLSAFLRRGFGPAVRQFGPNTHHRTLS